VLHSRSSAWNWGVSPLQSATSWDGASSQMAWWEDITYHFSKQRGITGRGGGWATGALVLAHSLRRRGTNKSWLFIWPHSASSVKHQTGRKGSARRYEHLCSRDCGTASSNINGSWRLGKGINVWQRKKTAWYGRQRQ